jgi:hypothetical protein
MSEAPASTLYLRSYGTGIIALASLENALSLPVASTAVTT